MKKIIFGLFLVCSFGAMSCSPNRFFLVNSEGIFTYNRHTGQLEFMWETKEHPLVKDSMSGSSSMQPTSSVKEVILER